MEFLRANEFPITANRLGINPMLTGIVLGTPQTRFFPSERILRRISVPNVTFEWTKWTGNEVFKQYDTERGLRAEYGFVELAATKDSASLKRYTIAAIADDLELQDALPSLGLREKKGSEARDIIRLDIERRAKTLLAEPTTYPSGHRLAIASGSEWDSASGDSYADVTQVAEAIAASCGVEVKDVSVFLGPDAYRAALRDPVFKQSRVYTNVNAPDEAALRAYWGVKEVFHGSPREEVAGTMQFMYGDVAILFFNGQGADFDTTYGEYLLGATFALDRGVALEPWYWNHRTSWIFPWQDMVLHKITNDICGGIITNCKA